MNARRLFAAALGVAVPLHTHLFLVGASVGGVGSEYARAMLYGQDILWVLASTLFVWEWWKVHREKRATSLLLWLQSDTGLLGIVVLLACAFGIVLAPHGPSALALTLRLLAGLGALAWLAHAPTRARAAGWGVAISMATVSVLGLWQAFAQHIEPSTLLGLAAQTPARLGAAVAWVGEGRWLRPYATFPHPNIFGGMAVLGVLAALATAAQARTRAGARVAAWLAGACALGALASVSRAAALALAGALTVWAWRARLAPARAWRHGRQAWAYACVGALVGAWLFSAPWLGRVHPTAAPSTALETRSLTERGEQVHAWWAWTTAHPLRSALGVGLGQSTLLRASADAVPQPAWAYQPVHAAPLVAMWELGWLPILLALRWLWHRRHAALAFFKQASAAAWLTALLPIAFLDHYLWTQPSVWFAAGVVLLVIISGSRRDEAR